jgi:amidase
MARSVADAALVLAAMAGPDPADAVTAAQPQDVLAGLENLDAATLEGVRIGVARNYCGYHDGVDGVFASALEALSGCGAQVIDGLELTPTDRIKPSELEVLATEFKHGLNRYLAALGPEAPLSSLAELIDYNRAQAERVMPYFQQELLERAASMGPLDNQEYREALAESRHLSRQAGIDALCLEHNLEAIVAPTMGPPWLIDPVNGDHRRGGSACPAAVAGYPSVSLPAGYLHGLPVGLSFFSTAFRDAALLRLAHAFERSTRIRRPPSFAASVALDEG